MTEPMCLTNYIFNPNILDQFGYKYIYVTSN